MPRTAPVGVAGPVYQGPGTTGLQIGYSGGDPNVTGGGRPEGGRGVCSTGARSRRPTGAGVIMGARQDGLRLRLSDAQTAHRLRRLQAWWPRKPSSTL